MPLAVPAIAGPSALATVMLMASRDPGRILEWVVALTAAMAVTTLVLLGAPRLTRALGERGMLAVERLMGLVLTALAVQMLLNGIRDVRRAAALKRKGRALPGLRRATDRRRLVLVAFEHDHQRDLVADRRACRTSCRSPSA